MAKLGVGRLPLPATDRQQRLNNGRGLMLALGLIRQEFSFKRVPSTVRRWHRASPALASGNSARCAKSAASDPTFRQPEANAGYSRVCVCTGDAITSRVDRFQRCFVHGVAHIELTKARKGTSCAARSCGKHTIKHVNATFHGPHKSCGVPTPIK